MARPDRSIDPRIIKSAEKEFLANGYEKASLKEICQKAQITTGALYKRYKGKEDLFCAVVADTVAALNAVMEEKCSISVEKLSDEELVTAWEMNASTLWWFQFLYEHRNGFLLLIKCAEGTRYSDFQHDWVEVMTGKSYEYFLETRKRRLTDASISRDEMHILLSAFWTTIYEPFIHGYGWEQIKEHCKLICDLFNWRRVLGFPSV
ncbi:TetR family transcriptional regulator [Ruminiclostridium sufflavum DSM 19573]|uniref:TetR family transcriptional regulator n=1 Tax=Ruminiclostridium sufflavum DSM 19573 TaxID=1121337 RepID=A0A318XQW9_9FIRM|nr:TetR/AcrR family transcriptional regulator [Ruminiclostridium sufflavum]PYG88709.1 TetR family transcriptional regulator [Ruminiclostridium sufflavum DSM 19573]